MLWCLTPLSTIFQISWWSVLLVEEFRIPTESHRPVTSYWQTWSHSVVSSRFGLDRFHCTFINSFCFSQTSTSFYKRHIPGTVNVIEEYMLLPPSTLIVSPWDKHTNHYIYPWPTWDKHANHYIYPWPTWDKHTNHYIYPWPTWDKHNLTLETAENTLL
jgi:hypothetical protein